MSSAINLKNKMTEEKKPIELGMEVEISIMETTVPDICENCSEKIKIGEPIYIIPGAFVCEKCGKKSKELWEKRGYSVKLKKYQSKE
jgi:Zn finger protein HypA/HybF involved in hydrogenase expression